MNCQKCQSDRIASVSAKCDDRCNTSIGSFETSDYVPQDFGIGGGDYLKIKYCLNCGQLQGKFPLPLTEIESEERDGKTVTCKFCGEQTLLETAHLHQDSYVGDACCWDDRLKATE